MWNAARFVGLLVGLTACHGDAATPSGDASDTGVPVDASTGDATLHDAQVEGPPRDRPDAADVTTTTDATVTDGAPAADGRADAPNDGGIASPTALVHFAGRFDTSDPSAPRFAWPGSAIAATFTGTGISVKLHDTGTNFFSVVLDGQAATRLSTSSATDDYMLASGLSAGQHTLVLTKATESYDGVVTYLGLTPQGGALVATPDQTARRLEFIGDSITCGYGDLANTTMCTSSSDAQEDETIAYGALTAVQLGAQQTVIAYSGIGMYRGFGGQTADQMPVRFNRTLADDANSVWGFSTPAPDVVVVNLGTNDFAPPDGGQADPGPAFGQTYVTFLQQLRTHYPNAYILCALSPMLGDPSRTTAAGYIQGAVHDRNAAGDTRVSYVEFAQQQASDGYGCDYHPSRKTHENMAATLVAAIRTLTGW